VSALPIGWCCQLPAPAYARTRIDALTPNDGLRWTAIFALYLGGTGDMSIQDLTPCLGDMSIQDLTPY